VFDQEKKLVLFASEKYILSTVIKRKKINCDVQWIRPFTGLVVDLDDLSIEEFVLRGERVMDSRLRGNGKKMGDPFKIKDFSPKINKKPVPILSILEKRRLESLLEFNDISHLKRCSICVLPETFPFIEFDEKGVCNYCRNYKKAEYLGAEKLQKIIAPYRSKTGEPDCLVPFSGGRDSSYGLHYIKTVLKMNPIAFTYDWGMVTDLARRNQARICGQLGIEQILLSADIQKKRENIRKNVLAWLKKPDLGIIPLFMAGDKTIFRHLNKLKGQIGIKLNIWMANELETTDFKSGFSNIPPNFQKELPYILPLKQKLKLAGYYFNSFLRNPSYFNSSVFDTLFAYYCQYFEPKGDFLSLYHYIKWNEKEIESTLFNEYDWETSPDTKSTWRIGDGTSGFYNYIYYTVAGFSEIETFRSNQIREGLITREEAIKAIQEENKPRYDSIKWYCDTIGIDFEDAIKKINSIPKLY
jgi:hypothetical protein